MMDGLQYLQQWQVFMNHPKGAWLGFINAIQAVRGIITYPIQADVADRYGRRLVFMLASSSSHLDRGFRLVQKILRCLFSPDFSLV